MTVLSDVLEPSNLSGLGTLRPGVAAGAGVGEFDLDIERGVESVCSVGSVDVWSGCSVGSVGVGSVGSVGVGSVDVVSVGSVNVGSVDVGSLSCDDSVVVVSWRAVTGAGAITRVWSSPRSSTMARSSLGYSFCRRRVWGRPFSRVRIVNWWRVNGG